MTMQYTLSPKLEINLYDSEINFLMGRLEALEHKLDNMRGAHRRPFNTEMRNLAAEISRLESRYFKLRAKHNPIWSKHWGLL